MRAITLGLVCATALATASTAHAEDMAGRFGVGADTTLGNYTGAAAHGTYHVSNNLGLQFQLNTELNTGADDGVLTTSSTAFNVRALIALMSWQQVQLQALAGFGLRRTTLDPNTMGLDSESSHDFGVEIGVRPEWFIAQHFSLHLGVGMLILILDDRFDSMGDPIGGGTQFSLFTPSSLVGEAGFTFYF